MQPRTINRLYEKLSKSMPDAKTELTYKNHFELLVSVILSAQATDKSVNAATVPLFKKYSTPQSILKLGEAGLKDKIKTIGLAPTKARNIVKTCRILLDQHAGVVPEDREALEALPGVGRKTANVVLNEGFGHPTIAVDTHVFRVANRTGLAPGKNVVETEENLLKVTPKKWLNMAHHYLVLHGRYVCTARNYKCDQCVISKECEFEGKLE